MESRNSGGSEYSYEKESPSQENITHLQAIKRDGESLEDFEDITKDVPSAEDLTTQFLQFETGDTNKLKKEEFASSDDQFDIKPKSSYYIEVPSSTEDINQILIDSENLVLSQPSSSLISDREDSFNYLYDFEQTEMQSKPEIKQFEEKPILTTLDKTKLRDKRDDEVLSDSDALSSIQNKRESSILNIESEKDLKMSSDYKSSEATETYHKTKPLLDFTPESGLLKEQELEVLQGDGLHVKYTAKGDLSDNDDDFIPEPVPKDYPEIGVLEGKQFLTAIGLDAWFHPDFLNPKVESLIYWRDPKKSGIVFGGILIVLLSLTSFSLISVLAYTSLIALFVASAFRIYKSVMQAVQKTSEGHPFKEYLDVDLTISSEKAREISDVIVSYINRSVTECRRLFLMEDVIDSIKFGVLLWSLTYIGAWFNGLSLLIIGFVGLFTLPKVYENNKTQIDANIEIVKVKINEATEKITAVIPLGKKTEDIKDKAE